MRDSLYALYGKNKIIPQAFELPTLVALSHYPELTSTPIRFKVKKAKLPYASKPTAGSMLRFWGPKSYVVTISSRSTAIREPTLLKNLCFQEQVGALGHELAHASYYEQQTRSSVLRSGIRYANIRFKSRFEKMTDRIALDHGLAPYLLAWNTAVYPVKLQDGKRAHIYYTPAELSALISTLNHQ